MGRFDVSASQSKLLEITYNTVCESISQQRADLRVLRSQASIIAAVSGLVCTMFLSLIVEFTRQEEIGLFSDIGPIIGFQTSLACAVVAFSLSVVLALLILTPQSGWKFEDSPKKHLGCF